MRRFRAVAALFKEFWLFVKVDRTWWMAPLLFVLVAFGALVIFAEGSALAPLIYSIF
jgi:hypothetical protein